MVTPAGIAFGLVVNTVVPDLYRLLKSTLGPNFDQKVNRAYHRAVAAVLEDADQRKISVKQGLAPMGSESYRSLIEFFQQREFMVAVARTILISNPLGSGHLSTVYPPALNETISLDSLLDRFHSRLQEAFTDEFGQDFPLGMPLLLSFVRADIEKVQSSVNEGFENIRDTVDEGFESMLQKLDAVLPSSTVSEQTITYWLDRPGTIGVSFVGREPALATVEQNIEDRRLAVISSGAGGGKTRLAAEYAHRTRMNGFWTTAGNNVDATLAALAPSLGKDIGSRGDEEVAAEVRRALAALPPETLWVIDNLESLEQVNTLVNAAGIRLLITSRDDRGHELSTNRDAFQRLPELDPDTAIQWLATASGSNVDNSALEEIAQLVGYLPLALEMLAIRLGGYGQTPDSVREDLQRPPTPIQMEKFREAGGTTIDYPQGVYNAITGALEVLPTDVREGISPLGYLADAPIPHALLLAATGMEDEELGEVIEACRRSSVVSVVERDVVVHALTIAAIAATNPAGILETVLNRAGRRLVSINQNHHAVLRAEITHHERILAESKKILELDHLEVATFANGLASGYLALGRYEEAVRLHEETLDVMERVLGPEHPDTLASRNNLAVCYLALGRNEEAVRLHEETLGVRERVLGPEHPDTLASRNNLASGYRALGRYQEAVGLDEETLGVRERVLGPEHPDTLANRNNLAGGYRALGRNEEAVGLDEETLSVRERVLGPEHPGPNTSRNNLAIGYSALGRNEDAVGLHEETLRVRERVLGPEHPDTLASRSNLAIGYRALGRYPEAVELDEETLGVRERMLGPEHPGTLTSRNNLAIGYRNLGRHQEAVELDEETLRVMERVLGPEHPDTLTSRSNLASDYRALGRYQDAVELDEETLRVRERVLGPEHPDTLASRNNLAIVYRALGRDQEAVKLHEETLRVRERVLGPEHPDTLQSRNNLANGYRALGHNTEADELDMR